MGRQEIPKGLIMEIALNPLYVEAIDAITSHVKVSRGGKRYWDNNGTWWKDDTTYPDYVRFFFVNRGMKKCKEGEIFSGNRQELLRLLAKARTGVLPKSERLRTAFEYIIRGYLIELEDIKREEEARYGFAR